MWKKRRTRKSTIIASDDGPAAYRDGMGGEKRKETKKKTKGKGFDGECVTSPGAFFTWMRNNILYLYI